MTSAEYAGAIFTAVCFALVVAPPIRSGRSKPVRFISRPTWTISSRLGVIRPERPMISTFSSRAVSEDRFARHHNAEVDYLKIVAA